MNEIIFKTPTNQKEHKEYDLFRWKILRKPIGKDISSLKDKFEESAYHLIGIKDKKIISGDPEKIKKIYGKGWPWSCQYEAKTNRRN